MGSLFGSTTTATPSPSIVGQTTQGNFFNSLYGLGLTTNPADGTMMFNSMPAYQGQLTPDLSKAMSTQVQNNWQQQSPGMATAQALTNNAQFNINPAYNSVNAGVGQGNTQSGPLSFLSSYMQPSYQGGGGGGSGQRQMMMPPMMPQRPMAQPSPSLSQLLTSGGLRG